MTTTIQQAANIALWVNQNIKSSPPLTKLALRIGAVATLAWLGTAYMRRWNESTLEMVGRNLLRIPAVQRKLNEDVKQVRDKEALKVRAEWEEIEGKIEERLERHLEDEFFKFRDKGYSVDEILKIFDVVNKMIREKVCDKRFSGAIYPNVLKSKEIIYPERVKDQSDLDYLFMVIASQAGYWNSLHKEFSPVRFLQHWASEMVANLLGAEAHSTVGFDTTGGTGSIMHAVRIFRERGRERGIEPGKGVIIAPKSIHAAELKGGYAYDVKFVLVDLDENGAVDLVKMKAAIDKYAKKGNLLGAFVSAPNYGTGTVDPIKEVIDHAKKCDVPVHVDACLGGFVLNKPYFAWGASSVSIDPHKNGHAQKGMSYLMVKKELAKYSVYAFPNWTCIYGTPADEGSKACVSSLCSFAALLYYGKSGYLENAKKIIACKDMLVNQLKEIKDIQIVGRPDVNVIAIRLNIADGATYALAHEMSTWNWELNALKDNMLHICITTRLVESDMSQFITTLKHCIGLVKNMADQGKSFPGDAGIYCSMGEALMPDPKKLRLNKYVENLLLGKKGAEESVKAYIVAQLNPYDS